MEYCFHTYLLREETRDGYARQKREVARVVAQQLLCDSEPIAKNIFAANRRGRVVNACERLHLRYIDEVRVVGVQIDAMCHVGSVLMRDPR